MTNVKLQNDCWICSVIESRKYQFSLSRSRVTMRLSFVRWKNKYTAQHRRSHLILNHFTNCKWAKQEKSNNRDARTKHKFSITWRWFTIKSICLRISRLTQVISSPRQSITRLSTHKKSLISHFGDHHCHHCCGLSVLWGLENNLIQENKSNRNSKHCTTMTNDTWPNVSLQVTSNGNQDEIL